MKKGSGAGDAEKVLLFVQTSMVSAEQEIAWGVVG